MLELRILFSPATPFKRWKEVRPVKRYAECPKVCKALGEFAEIEAVGFEYADRLIEMTAEWVPTGPSTWLVPDGFEVARIKELLESAFIFYGSIDYVELVEAVKAAALEEVGPVVAAIFCQYIPTLSQLEWTILPQVTIVGDDPEGIGELLPSRISRGQWAADTIIRDWLDNPTKLINGRGMGRSRGLNYPTGLPLALSNLLSELPSGDRTPWLKSLYELSHAWLQLAPIRLLLHAYEPSDVDALKAQMERALKAMDMDALVELASRIKLLTTEQSADEDCDPTDVGGCAEAEAKLCDSLNDASSDSVGTEDEEIDEDGDEIEATIDSEPDEF